MTEHEPTDHRFPRRVTAALAVTAAVAGAAVAGTFAGASDDGTARLRATSTSTTTSTTAKPLTPAQRAAAKKKAAAKKAAAKQAAEKKQLLASAPVVRVLVKRGATGRTGLTGDTGAAGPAGPAGPTGPQGPAAHDVVRSLSLNWIGTSAGLDTTGADVPGFGRLDVTCNPTTSELRLTPSRTDARTVLTADVYSGTNGDHERRASTGDPLVVSLPVSGLVTATLSIEPTNGDGGAGPTPATLTLSVESKSNADPANPDDKNFCYAAGQVLQAG